MIRTEYFVRPVSYSVDLRAAADACNRELMASGETFDRDAAEKKISECATCLRDGLFVEPQETEIDEE